MSTPLFTRFPLRSLALATVMLACGINAQAVEPPKPHPWRDARQLVLVVTDGWDATSGTLTLTNLPANLIDQLLKAESQPL